MHNISLKDNKKNIDSLFDKIALRYDLLNHLLTLNIDKYWRKKTVNQILVSKDNNQNNNNKILDIATGTGDLLIEILKQKKTTDITGIDLSENMLEIGKEKINKYLSSNYKKGNSPKVDLLRANVEQLPFLDNSFSAITCAFGVRNFAHLDKGIEEMYRVLDTNGQLIILEFAYPKNRIIRFFYNIYFTYLLPFIGKIISKDNTAYKYLMQSVKNFPKGKDFLEHLSVCGFDNTTYKSLTCGIVNIYSATKK